MRDPGRSPDWSFRIGDRPEPLSADAEAALVRAEYIASIFRSRLAALQASAAALERAMVMAHEAGVPPDLLADRLSLAGEPTERILAGTQRLLPEIR